MGVTCVKARRRQPGNGRFHKLFRDETTDGGKTWNWSAITADSSTDNLRPPVPVWPDAQGRTLLVWMRGGYRVNRGEWNTAVVATLLPPR